MRDYFKNNFLPEDHEQAIDESICYHNCINEAKRRMYNDQLDQAIAYLENAKRSEKVLAELRDKHDKAWFILKQNEADRTMKELVQSQLVKAHD